MRRITLILPVVLLAASGAFGQTRNYNAYHCGIGDLPPCPVIDGDLSDEAWSDTSPYIPLEGDFRRFHDGLPSAKQSSIAVTYDETRVYFALIAPDLEANPYCGISDVWQGDCVQVFLDIDEGGPDYTDYWQIVGSGEGCESSQWSLAQGMRYWDWDPAGLEVGGSVPGGIELSITFDSFAYDLCSDPLPGNPPPKVAILGFCAYRSEDSSWCHIYHLGDIAYQFGTLTFNGPVPVAPMPSWGEIKAGFK